MSEQSSGKPGTSPPPWSLLVAVAEIPDTGRRVVLDADAKTREAVAKLANVQSVPRLKAEFELMRQGRDGVQVVGTVSATVEQNCVVTLEPMQSEVEEAIDLIFAPPHLQPSEDADDEKPKIVGDDLEPLPDGVVDLGAVATEFLILGIDPYPRKPGVVFKAPKMEEDGPNRPFAALAALKKGKPGSDS